MEEYIWVLKVYKPNEKKKKKSYGKKSKAKTNKSPLDTTTWCSRKNTSQSLLPSFTVTTWTPTSFTSTNNAMFEAEHGITLFPWNLWLRISVILSTLRSEHSRKQFLSIFSTCRAACPSVTGLHYQKGNLSTTNLQQTHREPEKRLLLQRRLTVYSYPEHCFPFFFDAWIARQYIPYMHFYSYLLYPHTYECLLYTHTIQEKNVENPKPGADLRWRLHSSRSNLKIASKNEELDDIEQNYPRLYMKQPK